MIGWLKQSWITLLAAGLGAGAGAAYALKIGCVTGGCPITSSPWLSGLFGAVLAWSLAGVLVGERRAGRPGDSASQGEVAAGTDEGTGEEGR